MNNKERFNYLLKGYFWGYLPFGALFGVLSLLGIIPFNFNEKEYYGIIGLGLMLVFIPIMVIMTAVLNWIFLSFGFWIHSFFYKSKK
jgi:hypothetical protein